MKKCYVYIAGPISKGNFLDNIRAGILAGNKLWRMNLGFVPYIPHLDFTLYLMEPFTWEQILELDESWLAKCDVMYRLPGESPGADREEAFCEEHGIPVFHNMNDLLRWRTGDDDVN